MPPASVEDHWDHEADVIVLGLGAAGCAAAIAAHEDGARVLVLEKMPGGLDGGNTRISGGAWFDNRDPENGAVYLRALCGDFPVPEAVIEAWSRETAANAAWVESLGARVAHHGEYLPEYPELPGSSAYGGYFGVNGELGQGLLFGVLRGAVEKRGIRILHDCPGRELLREAPGGRICGVRAESQGSAVRVAARRGVILATGGFENNPEMVRDYLRLADASIWGSAASTGDGIQMAQQVGADLWHMDNMAAYTGVRVPGFSSAFYVSFDDAQGFIYLGMDGTRLVNERPQTGHGQAMLHGSYHLFPAEKMHVLFDEATRRSGPSPRERTGCPWDGTCSWRATSGARTTAWKSRRVGSTGATRRARWRRNWGWKRRCSRRRSSATTGPANGAWTRPSAARPKPWWPCANRPSTPSRRLPCWAGATADRAETNTRESSTPSARPSPASTRPAA